MALTSARQGTVSEKDSAARSHDIRNAWGAHPVFPCAINGTMNSADSVDMVSTCDVGSRMSVFTS